MTHEKIRLRTESGQTIEVSVLNKRPELIEVGIGQGVHSVRCTLKPTRSGRAYAGSVHGREVVYEHSVDEVKAALKGSGTLP